MLERKTDGKSNLVVLFKEGKLMSYPFSSKDYLESYRDFFKVAEKRFAIFIIRGMSKYRGDGVFTGGFRWNGSNFVRHHGRIAARVVYNKGRLVADGGAHWAIINVSELHRISRYKDLTHKIFPKLMKRGYRIYSRPQFLRALKKIQSQKAVFKPVDGFAGQGIIIKEKDKLMTSLRRFNGLLEEFIDTSQGVPGLTPSYHDVRMTIMDGKLVQCYIRVPRHGSLLANVARGGSLHEFSPRSLPRTARHIANLVDKRFKKYGHRVYSVDVGYEGSKPFLFEINDQPGVPHKKWERFYREWHATLLGVLLAADRDLR